MSTITILQALKDLHGDGDPENAHVKADKLLIDYLKGHDAASKEIADAWEAACERVGFWYA